jgi:hypothetical protein
VALERGDVVLLNANIMVDNGGIAAAIEREGVRVGVKM